MLHPENILVVRLSSLGDVVMTLPAVHSLKRGFPESKIHWVCEGSAYELLLCMEFIDEVIKFPREKIVDFLRTGRIIESTKAFVEFLRYLREKQFDIVIDFHGILRSALICLLSRRRRLIGFGRAYAKEYSHIFYDERVNGANPFLHKVERNMLIVNHLKVHEYYESFPFKVPKEDQVYVESFFHKEKVGEKVFAINPFSSKRGLYKRWPLEKYRELIKKIQKEIGADVVLIWGTKEEKKEAEKLRASLDGDLNKNLIVSWPTNVPQLLALLSKVDMYIGGDSGITHVAALARTPVVAIFGPSDYRINSPYGEMIRIVRMDVPCSPCRKRDCEDRRCLENITSDDVFEVVKTFYKERSVKK